MSLSKEERFKALHAMRDEDLDFSDNPETDEAFWKNAKLVEPGKRERITIKLEQEVLNYFRSEGPGYQTRINAVLKAYVLAQAAKNRPG